MYRLLGKRYRKVLILLIVFLTAGLFMEMAAGRKEPIPVVQEVFDTYLNEIKTQEENVSGIAIFGGEDSYNVRKIHKTAELYSHLEDISLVETVNNGASILLSDGMVYLFVLLFLIFEMYVFVYDKDKGYDHLIHTLKLGNREYVRQKLILVLSVMAGFFLIGRIVKLCYVSIRHGSFENVPLQSVETFAHSWMKVSVYEFYWIQTFWQMFWVVCIGVAAAFLCHLTNRIWKAAICTIFFALFFLLIQMNDAVEKIGLLFQLSSGYFTELCLVPIGSTPVNGVLLSLMAGVVLAVGFSFVLWKYGNRVAVKVRGRSSDNRNAKNVKAHGNFYYECRKVFVINGYGILLVLLVVFQIFHYSKDITEIDTAQYYYRQYMEALEGKYSAETEVYLEQEKARYEAMEKRLQELYEKMQSEGLNAKENSELQKLQGDKQGEEGYRMAVKRAAHVKKNAEAEMFDDISLQRIFCEGRTDSLLDCLITLVFAFVFGGLLCFEDRVYDLKNFLSAMPGYEKMNRNKQVLILEVCAILSLMAVLPKTIAVGVQMGYNGLTALAYSVEYLPQMGMPVWGVIVLVFLIHYIISSLVTTVVWKAFR